MRPVESDFYSMSRTRPGFALLRNSKAVRIPQGKNLFVEHVNFGERFILEETWRRLPGLNASIGIAYNPDFELLGTNAVNGSASFDAEGGLKLTTAGANNDQVILLPHLDAAQSAWASVTWGTDREVVFREIIKTGASIAALRLWWGLKLTNTATAGTDNDEVFIRYEAGVSSGKFVVHWAINNTDSSTVTEVTVAADTVYDLRIEIDSNRRAYVYINDVKVATTGILTDAVDLIPYLGIHATTGAAKSVTTRKRAIGRVAA